MSGKFAGGVSGVVRTNVLKKLFPANYYGLVNKSYGWQVIEAPIAEWSESASWFNEGKSNPNLIVSQVRDLKIVDATPWQLWIAKSDQDFYGRHDVKQANTIFYAGMIVSLLLGGILIFGAWSAFTNQERLVRKVEEKTIALSERNDQMALILNNAEEGFLTLNLDGTMAEERSAIVDTWFGTPSSGMKFWDYISAGQSQATLLRMGWDQLVEGVFSFEMSADQMPKMVTRDKLTLSLKFKAVNDLDHKLFKVLVMITDVTALIEAAKREVQQRELLAVFQKFSTDRSGFLQFFHDAKEIIQRIYHRNAQGNRDVDFREVHTLKGNASQFGMISVAEVCHQIETELSEAGRPLVNEERLQLKLAWEEASESLKDFIKDENVNQLVVGQTEYQRLLKLLRATRGAEHFAEQLESWSLESTVVPFRRLGEQVQALTQRLGKGDIEVVILDHGVRLDAEYLREFWMNTTHLVRNTADHAIESPEERLKLGKGKPKITFESKLQGPNVVLTFTDDGCGIRWSKISDIAKRKGLPSASKKDLVMALFADGVSTSDEVSAISGRGVGMSALLSSVTSLGGNIDIASEIGKGTCISITLPCKAAETVKVA